jgi:peptidyl-prolyl cis-trans isomerase D
MAVIGKIRSYSGLLIAVIGIALAAFVLGDFMGYGPSGSQNLDVGSVGRKRIIYPDFEERVAQALENWRNQTGNQNPGQRETFQVRQQVWEQMVREILLAEEFDKLGIKISPDELTELVIGNNPHPAILQSFTNPSDGSFNPQTVIEFVQNLSMMEPSMQDQWFMLEDYIREQRKEEKYHSLIRKGFYIPEEIARADYQEKNSTADVSVALKRFEDIPDSLVVLNERDLRRTYNEHKNNFKKESSRDLEYVVFPIFPSDQDRETIKLETQRLKEEFATAENIENFINVNSDARFNPAFFSPGELAPAIDSLMFNSDPGTIYGPYLDNNAFVVAKLTEVQFRPDSMKASHILIAHRTSRSAGPQTTLSKEQAQAKADSLLTVVRRSPEAFSSLASELSDDPSAASNEGDLGWFPDGAMVTGFNEAVINNSVNSFTVAESEFGYHIIHITGKSAPTKKVQVALLTRNIEHSNQTFQLVYGQANEFATTLRDKNDFDAVVEEQGLSKRVVDNLRPMDNAIPGIENPRGIIQWAFAERTQKGTISQIFDMDGRFVVARVSKVTEEGIPSLDEIREEIRTIAINEIKAQMIINEINSAAGVTLDEIAANLNLEPRNVEGVRFSNNNLQGFGNEPAVVGSIFALQANSGVQAVKGNAGVYLVEIKAIQPAIEPENFVTQQTQLKNAFRNRVPNEAFRALRESAEVKDNRHMFF